MIFIRNSSVRFGPLLVLTLLLSACASSVAIEARFPARHAETADIRRVVVGRFEGRGGEDLARALESVLVSATFDGQRHFSVVGAGGSSARIDSSRAASAGRSLGAQGVLLGDVKEEYSTSRSQGSQSQCVRREDGKCKKTEMVPVTCWQRLVVVIANVRMIRTADGQVIYSQQRSNGQDTSWCGDASQSESDQSLAIAARAAILEDVRRDIAPYNDTMKAVLKSASSGLSPSQREQFAEATKLAAAGNIGDACSKWASVHAEAPDNLSTVYNLGVCAESSGAYARALDLYRKALALASGSDSAAAESITRTTSLLYAENSLALQQAQREADAAAARQRSEAEQRAESARAAQAARSRSEQAAAARAAEARRQQEARARYGNAAPAVLAGRVTVGMNKDQVTASRGKPASVRKLSATEEMWSYPNMRVVFINGRVSSVR